uniref:Oxysterol-binding protein n=1 Tax=Monodelphis domestica TaxID=13616 RepID=F6RMU5_MONDO
PGKPQGNRWASGQYKQHGKKIKKVKRIQIPSKPTYSLNLWSMIKNYIGKELSKIPLLVNFSEPLSMLQRLTEDLEYHELLDQAARCENSLEQMCYVGAFIVSSYSTTVFRTNMPFSPLLGETFELDQTEESGFRSLCEQVNQHPPVAAHHVDSRNGWTFHQEIEITGKFHGKFLDITPSGTVHCIFHATGHHYTWKKALTTVNNIILGKLWIDQSGEIEIANHKTGDKCILKFIPQSYLSQDVPRKITGQVIDPSKKVHFALLGTWDEKVERFQVFPAKEYAREADPGVILWKRNPLPKNAENMYYFSEFALTLNALEDGVAPTDSRLRPDQRLMENGYWDEANAEKWRLEEKQRVSTKKREGRAARATDSGTSALHKALWFEQKEDPITRELVHMYRGGYWECKEKRNWALCPNIF